MSTTQQTEPRRNTLLLAIRSHTRVDAHRPPVGAARSGLADRVRRDRRYRRADVARGAGGYRHRHRDVRPPRQPDLGRIGRANIADILRRAIAAGELRADTDVEMAIDLMVGAPVYRWLVTARPVDADAARRFVDAVWDSLRPSAS
jgi:Tetracyclin repressor-like, C-terminal domain